MATHAIILSGGHGTRLWPASRPSRPKQFLPLTGAQSMFQATVRRMAHATDEGAPIVVAGPAHREEITRQLGSDASAAILLIEPEGRDSAAAIAAAAAWIVRSDPEGVGVLVASDHHLPDHEAFAQAVRIAVAAARKGGIVTFGISPRSPSTAYGYIRAGEAGDDPAGARPVERFAEKPDAASAVRYVAEGYLWNSGNFVFKAATLLEELDRFAPEVANAARAAVADAVAEEDGVMRLSDAFLRSPRISIDYAVMEKTDRAVVVPLSTDWSDLGAWDAVHAASAQDGDGNVAPPDAILMDTRRTLVRTTTDQLVTAIGVEDLAILVESDAVLVTRLSASQDVKSVVDRLKTEARPQVDGPATAKAATPGERLQLHAHDLGVWMRANALPLWSTLGVDREQGAFRDLVGLDGESVAKPRRLRVQGRQTFVYAQAGARGWTGPWPDLVKLGLHSLRHAHRRPDGGYRTLVSDKGEPLDDAVMVYDQAFVVLALCWAYRTGVAPDGEKTAMALLDDVLEPRRNPLGGFREADVKRPWQSNPHMHLFEACMAWVEAGGGDRWSVLAAELAELALTRFICAQSGAVREFFKEDWSPADGPDGRLLDAGHQFEWAWLLDRWAVMTGRPDVRPIARRLYAIGSTHGIDPGRGVAINELNDDFSVRDAGARLWPQTERLKAALRLADNAEGGERDRLLSDAAAAADGLNLYLKGVTAGLWRDKLQPDGVFVEEPSPASSLYHIACAVAELEDRTAAPAA